MSLTRIQQGMIADAAVLPQNLNTTGTANSQTILSGTFAWIYQDSYYFDMGVIGEPVTNMIQLLLQVVDIDFETTSVVYDGNIA